MKVIFSLLFTIIALQIQGTNLKKSNKLDQKERKLYENLTASYLLGDTVD